MIGLALVLFVTIYASGLRDGTRRIIRQTFVGDLTIQSQDGQSPIPAAAVRAAAQIPNLQAVSAIKAAPGRLARAGDITVESVEPTTIGQVYRFDWTNGSSADLDNLTSGQALVERNTAVAAHLSVGDHTTLVTETGMRMPLTVTAIYADRALLPGITLSRAQFDAIFDQPRLQDVFVKLAPGSDVRSAQETVAQALSAFPGVAVRSDRQLADQVAGRVDSILILFYALLVLSVVMSLLGIVNTLNLSIYERTRELGMLRAMGMTAEQARVMIRNEGLITAAIGSLIGVALGVFLAWAITHSLRADDVVFAPPWLQVVGVLAVGLVAGVLASGPPARRAARLDVLSAIAHE
jgi:putative ABC transport system permease protein